MSNPFWKLILWVLGFAALFLIVLSGLTHFTDVEFIEIVTAMNSIGILVVICVGGVFAYQRLQIFRTFTPHMTRAEFQRPQQCGHTNGFRVS